MKDFVGVVALMVVLFCEAPLAQGPACNMTHAAGCVRSMQQAIDRVIETASGLTRTETLQELCLDVIKGNNLTQCYLQATGGCGGGQQGAGGGGGGGRGAGGGDGVLPPSHTAMQDWEGVMQDLYALCDGACPNFLERTINITQCTSLIRFDDLFDNSYNTFCRSLNASLQCSREVSSDCPLFSQLFFDLLPRGIDDTADTICSAGCDNFEEALTHLESCKSYVTNLPDDLDSACSAYADFRACLQGSEVPMTCPIFGALMDVLYPQHIFGLYEEQCNITEGDLASDKCGSRGMAKLDHCLRILALAWPVNMDDPVISKEQCAEYRSGQRCIDKAGVSECPVLQQYLTDRTADKHRHRAILDTGCAAMLNDDVGAQSSAVSAHSVLHTWRISVTVLGIPPLFWIWR
ncbi:uncharacterized protein LOC143274882 [Babylonia areolata]|uniref:uncharacterized protein LOC143274882 n=1 Tax=Babylonia areolata TaxID=304850 RepID=UPI003FCF7B82